MTKRELGAALRERLPQATQQEAAEMVDAVFTTLTDALCRGERIEVRGFGNLSLRHRVARMGRNPRTGETVAIPAKRLPVFKASPTWLARLNDNPRIG